MVAGSQAVVSELRGRLCRPVCGVYGRGGNTGSGQRGAMVWYPPRDGCWGWHRADPGNEESKANVIVVVSLSRAPAYLNETMFSVEFIT